jgi:CRP-like cAMP-binding protein
MSNHLIQKIERRDKLSEEEREVLRNIVVQERSYERECDIVQYGDEPRDSNILLEGMVARCRILDDGRRQLLALHVPGDFVDLQSFLLQKMDHSVTAMTRCRIAMVPHAELRKVTEQYPHLSRLLWLSTLIDSAIHREWLLGMGRQSAVERLGRLICELYARLEVVGLAAAGKMQLALTQIELGDALGLSTVHVNRVVQELRARNLIIWRGHSVEITDWDALAALSHFDPIYLHLGPRPT